MKEDEHPRTLAGRFRLEALLGQGGMGTVYRAVDTMMQRAVAIKLITPDPSAEDDAVSRFLREARNTARITHPHIVHVYDLGRGEAGELFFVMELLGGESLSQRLRREPPLSVDSTIHIAKQICAALGYAHKRGVVHRDLKPGNIMILERGGDSQFVKVLDFGVAKAQDQGTQITKAGSLVGTVDYMAPEQILSRKVDARTDVYSLGVILYRMFTGTPLFPEGAVPVVIKHHVSSKPEPMRVRAPEALLSASLERVVMRCLAKNPDERYATMEELEQALVRAAREPREAFGTSDARPASGVPESAPDRGRATSAESRRPSLPPKSQDSETRLAIPRAASSPDSPRASLSAGAARADERGPGTASVEIDVSEMLDDESDASLKLHGSGARPALGLSPRDMTPREPMPSSNPSSVRARPPTSSSSSVWRWLGFVAPLPPAVYMLLVGPTPLALATLGGGLVIGGLMFILGIGRSGR